MKRLGPAIGGGLLIAFLTLMRILDPVILQDLRHSVFDTYQRTHPRPYQPTPVRIIDIDTESLARIGQWPWSRNTIATLIDRVGQTDPASIALDMVLSEPDRLSPARLLAQDRNLANLLTLSDNVNLPDYDHQLAETVADYPVVGGFALSRIPDEKIPLVDSIAYIGARPHPAIPNYTGALLNLPILERALTGNGSITAEQQEFDTVVRRIPLILRKGEQLLASLSLEALRVSEQAQTVLLRSAVLQGQVQLERLRVGQFAVPVTSTGELWLHYTEVEPERTVPAWRILQSENKEGSPPINFKDQIVLIGASATGLGDFATTALGTTQPGVEIHAQALEQMVLGWYLERPAWAAALEVALFVVLGIALVALLSLSGPLWAFVYVLTTAFIAIVFSWLAFAKSQLLFDPPGGGSPGLSHRNFLSESLSVD